MIIGISAKILKFFLKENYSYLIIDLEILEVERVGKEKTKGADRAQRKFT